MELTVTVSSIPQTVRSHGCCDEYAASSIGQIKKETAIITVRIDVAMGVRSATDCSDRLQPVDGDVEKKLSTRW